MSTPEKMAAVEIAFAGGPDALKPTQVRTPYPGEGEVLIKVAAAGVNRPDIMQRKGLYPPPPGASELPGLEVAGTIAAVGRGIKRFKEGDEVCALVHGGGYAEYVTVAEPTCLPVPKGLSMSEAAGLPETFFTVWANVFERGALQPGEVLLVHGGSSGIGTTAIMIASNMGARVFATAGSAEKCKACEELGAERAINYMEEDYVAVVKEATEKRGANVILDHIGGGYLAQNMTCLAIYGRLVIIGLMGGAKAELNIGRMMVKRQRVIGSVLRARSVAEKTALTEAFRSQALGLFASGKLKPVIHDVLPLSDIVRAHEMMEANANTGKIMLSVDETLT